MARYKETAVNDGGSGGSKYGQLADNARANNPLAVPTPTYSGTSNPVNTGNTTTSSKPKIGGALGNFANENNLQMYSPSSSSGGSNLQKFDMDAYNAQKEAEERARQEELRRLEEERRMREEQERLAQEARQAAVDTAQAEVEERREQPSSSYMPYGDPRQKTDNILAPARVGRYAGDYPAYTGEQPELYGQRNKNADYYRGRELVQPVYTTTQQAKDALKFGARSASENEENQTEFYTGPAAEEEPEREFRTRDQLLNSLSDVLNPFVNFGVRPAIAESTITTTNPIGGIDPVTGQRYFDNPFDAIFNANTPIYDNTPISAVSIPRGEQRAEETMLPIAYRQEPMLFPTDYGGTTIPGMPESPNPLAPSQQAARKLGGMLVNGARNFTSPILEAMGNGANEIVSDYDTAITNTDDVILDALAGLYNANESDGWLTEQASDLYGTLPKIDPDAPMADVLEQQRRERMDALARQILADDEIVEERPNITGSQIKTALKESQQEAREITNQLVGGAREITRPMRNDIVNWLTSGSNYGDNVTEAAAAAQAAGLIPGTPAYERFVNNYLGAIDGRTSENKNTNEKPRTYGYTDNILNSYANATGRALEDMDESDYRAMRDLNREATAVADQARFNALANGDVRNIPPQDLVSMLGKMTDTAYAQELEQQYQQFKDLGMNDRQISAELYRRAAEHMNPLARATDAQGNLHYDFALAGSGDLPEEMSVPVVDEYGNGNAAFNEFANSVDYFDKNGNTIYRNADGSFTEAVPKSDGTVEYRKYSGNPEDITSTYHYTPDQVLSMYVNPNGGRNGEPTWRGLDAVFEGLTPEERAGMEELLANFVGGGDLNRLRDGFDRETTGLTDEQYERLAQMFLNKMPAIQNLIDRGVLSERDVANFFFKAPSGSGSGSGGSGTGTGSGYGRRSYSGYGGYGYSRGGYGSGGYNYNYGNNNRGTQSNPSAASQRQNRVYNIMKNWSF